MGEGDVVEITAPAAFGAFLVVASHLNLNDPDWLLFSTAYALGAVICGWTVLQGLLRSGRYAEKDYAPQMRRRYVAMMYGAACLGFMAQIILFSPREDPPNSTDNVVLAFLSTEVCREAGGVLIMAQAMAHCAFIGRPLSGSSKPSTGAKIVRLVSVVVAVAAIFLGFFLPGYLERMRIVVPAHCGGGGE